MDNPFKYGEAVTSDNFCNRKNEIKQLSSYIRSAQNVFIYSERRLGKTSLIKEVIRVLQKKREIIAVYVDLQRASSPAKFLETYSSAIFEALLFRKEKIEKIASFFKRLIPSIELSIGGFKVSFDFSKTKNGIEKALEETYDLPQVIAQKYKKRVVVVFDEFQEIENFDGEEFEKKLRSFIQHHHNVCYIFMGSKTSVILKMFSDPKRAFYKSSATYPLLPIPEKEMKHFIKRQFSKSGKSIADSFCKYIIDITNNIPYYVQFFSWNLWELSRRTVNEQILSLAQEELLRSQNELFLNWFESCTLKQRTVLAALSQTKEIFSRDSIIKYNLDSPSSIQASLRELIKNSLVAKNKAGYQIIDPFFAIWLRKKG